MTDRHPSPVNRPESVSSPVRSTPGVSLAIALAVAGVVLVGTLFRPASPVEAAGTADPVKAGTTDNAKKTSSSKAAPKPATAEPAKESAAPNPTPNPTPNPPPARPGSAGHADKETIDRVVAVVNDEQILLSEVQEQVGLIQASQKIDLSDSANLAQVEKQVLDQLIEEKVIVDYATKQGITIADDQVNAKVEEMIGDIRQRIGSEEAFQKELKNQNLTLDLLRERYTQEVRRQMMMQRIIDREIRSKVKVTDADVDTFFRNNQQKIPAKPSQYHLAHILVTAKPDANRRAAARARANEVLRQLETGASWNDMVLKYSDDSSTKQNGGDLGDVEEGEFDDQFEAGIRDLKPGQRSGLVETRFGFHIIELVSRDGNRYHTRHILIQAVPTPTDEAAAIERANKARAQAEKGADWGVLVNSYSDDKGTRDKAGDLGNVPVTALPQEYLDSLDSLKVGGVSPVLRGPTGFHIFKLLGREQGGTYTLDEIRPQLQAELTKMKLSEEYDRWIAGVRKQAFIEIKGL